MAWVRIDQTIYRSHFYFGILYDPTAAARGYSYSAGRLRYVRPEGDTEPVVFAAGYHFWNPTPGTPPRIRFVVEEYQAQHDPDYYTPAEMCYSKGGSNYSLAANTVEPVDGVVGAFDPTTFEFPDYAFPYYRGAVIVDGVTGGDTLLTIRVDAWIEGAGGGVGIDDLARVWPLPPDWNQPVVETLAWGTAVAAASATAVSDHSGYQLGPQRAFGFEVAAARPGDRQLIDNLLAGYRGNYLLPIWPDVQRLDAALIAGDQAIACRTDGFDFAEGRRVLLWQSPAQWAAVEVAGIDEYGLALADPLAAGWPVGTRLYPLRLAQLQDGAEERLLTDTRSRRKLAFDIIEPCDWEPLDTLPEYLGHPVLEKRPDESDDPTAAYKRLLQAQAYTGAIPMAYDLADQALRMQSTQWKLHRRPEHSWFRELLYLLDGRNVPLWLPSFAADLLPSAAVAGGSTALEVAWCGYTALCKGRHNRRDLRIELTDGTVYYRRVVDAVETSGTVETLTLSAALDAEAIPAERIRQIAYMALSTLASDSVEIQHVTDADGLATATLGWQATVPDV